MPVRHASAATPVSCGRATTCRPRRWPSHACGSQPSSTASASPRLPSCRMHSRASKCSTIHIILSLHPRIKRSHLTGARHGLHHRRRSRRFSPVFRPLQRCAPGPVPRCTCVTLCPGVGGSGVFQPHTESASVTIGGFGVAMIAALWAYDGWNQSS